jgi:hypothetical protein
VAVLLCYVGASASASAGTSAGATGGGGRYSGS